MRRRRGKLAKETRKQSLIQLRERAKISASRMGFRQDEEDLAQSVVLAILEGRHKHATIDQAVIDHVRREFGRTDSPKQAFTKAHVSRDALTYEGFTQNAHALSPERMDGRSDFKKLVSTLKGTNRAIAILVYFWGFSYREIGFMFGVCESRVFQRVQKIHKAILEVVK